VDRRGRAEEQAQSVRNRRRGRGAWRRRHRGFQRLALTQAHHEVQLDAFDILALDGGDLRGLPLSLSNTNLAGLLARRPYGIFIAPFETG
jgi:hypothetical protein